MTTLNGLVGIDFNLAIFAACTSLSSQRPLLIHQFPTPQISPFLGCLTNGVKRKRASTVFSVRD
jgi:hypothetical protein